MSKPKIGIAFGSGVARGWAHIGVLRALESAGFAPDIISGTSIGALVGGCYAAGKLDELEDFARSLNRRRMLALLDLKIGTNGGLMSGNKLSNALTEFLGDVRIEDLGGRFVAVGTELATGHETWMRSGRLVDAIRASYAIPGIFAPVLHDDRWLIDGALVNPIPVSPCRAFGARVIIAINLNLDAFGRSALNLDFSPVPPPEPEESPVDAEPSLLDEPQIDMLEDASRDRSSSLDKMSLLIRNPALIKNVARRKRPATPRRVSPSLASVMLGSLNIMQDRLARSRMAGDPPDVLISPPVDHITLMEFDKASELIRLGEEATKRALPQIAASIQPQR